MNSQNNGFTFYTFDDVYSDMYLPSSLHIPIHEHLIREHKSQDQYQHTAWSQSRLELIDEQKTMRIGMMQLYGKTLDGQSVRCDVPFFPYFLWRFPITFSRDNCFQVWHALKHIKKTLKSTYKDKDTFEETTLGNCVYFVQFLALEHGQGFDFERKWPHLRLHFFNSRDQRTALQWLNQYVSPIPWKHDVESHLLTLRDTTQITPDMLWDEERVIVSEALQLPKDITLPEVRFQIQIFEQKIGPVFLWNKHWFNPNAWLTSCNHEVLDADVRSTMTTCKHYLRVLHPSALQWDEKRMDVPLLKIEVWDLETKGKEPLKDPNFQIFTSCSTFFTIGGNDPSKSDVITDIDVITWQPSNLIDNVNVIQTRSEKELICKIIERRREQDVDILIAHNGIAFDIVALVSRAEKLNVDRKYRGFGRDLRECSRLKTKGEGGDSMGVTHAGLIHIDTLVYYIEFHKSIKSKSLKSILKNFFDHPYDKNFREELVKERDSVTHKLPLVRSFCQRLDQRFLINSKQEFHYTKIEPAFMSGDPNRVRELLEYNITDVFQTARLTAYHSIVLSTIAFCRVFRVIANVFYTQGSEIKCLSRLWQDMYQKGKSFNIYQFPQDDPYLYTKSASGGAVREPIPGTYPGAFALDVVSMYPSIFREFWLDKGNIIEKRFLTSIQYAFLQTHYFFQEYNVQGDIAIVVEAKYIDPPSVSPRRKEAIQTCLPEIEAYLKQERSMYKDVEKTQAHDVCLATSASASEKAVKVLMNTYYGLEGQCGDVIESLTDLISKGAPLTVLKQNRQLMKTRKQGGYWPFSILAMLITQLGRDYIESTRALVTQTFTNCIAIYGDTDSLFWCSPYKQHEFATLEEFLLAVYHFAHSQVLPLINEYWKANGRRRGLVVMELDNVFVTLALGEKKKYYIGQKAIIQKDESLQSGWLVKKGKIKISGLELVKRDKANIINKIQTNMIDRFLELDASRGIEETKQMILSLKRNQVPLEDLVMVQVLGGDPKTMTMLTPALAVARRMESTGRGVCRMGEEYSFVFVKCPGKRNEECATTDLVMSLSEAKDTQAPINTMYYLEHHLRTAICGALILLFKDQVGDAYKMYDKWIYQNSASLGNIFANLQPKASSTSSCSSSSCMSLVSEKRKVVEVGHNIIPTNSSILSSLSHKPMVNSEITSEIHSFNKPNGSSLSNTKKNSITETKINHKKQKLGVASSNSSSLAMFFK